MKKILLKTLIIFMTVAGLVSAVNAAAYRRPDYDSVVIEAPNNYSPNGYNRNLKSKNINLSTEIKDKNEKLYAMVGKSQLLKFDEEVTRVSLTDPQYAGIVMLSPKELLLSGKLPGRTSLIFWGANNKPVFYNLIVQKDTDGFLQAVEEITPNENIKLNYTDDGIVISGYLSSSGIKKKIRDLAEAYDVNLLDMTESPTKQVLLEVKITEASRNFTRELETQFGFGRGSVQANNQSAGVFAGQASGFQYIFANNSAQLAFSLRAGEQKGAIKILAEPKLLALNNEEASFNVGNEVPVPSSVGQYGQVSYQFKNAGVNLTFKPQILEKTNRVILKLTPEVSEIDDSIAVTQQGGGWIPGFKTRKVDTTVELEDGETLIIAGLLKQTSSNNKAKVPLVSEIPVLGALFSNQSQQNGDTELVIFITPKIVAVNKPETL